MALEAAPGTDRRHRRREETIREIVDVAIELMVQHGAAGLSLGDVARQMGIRTPSLYGYFDSKNALYDAVFERGWRELGETMTPLMTLPQGQGRSRDELSAIALTAAIGFARWGIEHPAYAQLMFWRPVPGYQPAEAAYAPAVEVFELALTAFAGLRERGLFRADVDIDEAFRQWTVLIAGVVSQQLSNAPHEPFDGGTFTSGLPQLVAMFLQFYGPGSGPAQTTSRTTRRSHGSTSS
ncbi:MAG TPA: TetR/AcrR family transcriptional regulator [Frankiaceae bacterium]|jgi:AcrR family transcriptional regulator|nr:TetR/AcrR family transcriptional regulator [Frankiaceae bacterium]